MKLEFQNVTVAYGKKTVLENVSFSVKEGSITALLGRNGVGKTTLLRCLLGEKRDYSGKILLDGTDVRKLSRDQRAAMLACLPQELPLPRVTVEQLARFGRTPHLGLLEKPSEADREKVARALEAVGMTHLAEDLVDQLSGGQRKKAFFAMTLAQDTPLVVLDEPCAHLDGASRLAFLELLKTLCRETGKTFLVVMHELPEVLRLADELAVLQEGRQAFSGSPEQFLRTGIPERVFDVRITGSRESGFALLPK